MLSLVSWRKLWGCGVFRIAEEVLQMWQLSNEQELQMGTAPINFKRSLEKLKLILFLLHIYKESSLLPAAHCCSRYISFTFVMFELS